MPRSCLRSPRRIQRRSGSTLFPQSLPKESPARLSIKWQRHLIEDFTARLRRWRGQRSVQKKPCAARLFARAAPVAARDCKARAAALDHPGETFPAGCSVFFAFYFDIAPVRSLRSTSCAPPSTMLTEETSVSRAFSRSSGMESTPQLHIVERTLESVRETLSRRLPA